MSAGQSLKEQNAWLIRTALLLHAVAFTYVAFEPVVFAHLSQPNIIQKLQDTLVPGAFSLATIALARLVLLGLIPSRLRDRLIHWRLRHPLPGARAFTKFGPADPRVDMSKLQSIYSPLPTDAGEQAALFYKLYGANAEHIGVLDAHKSYLATRDIGSINFLELSRVPRRGVLPAGCSQ